MAHVFSPCSTADTLLDSMPPIPLSPSVAPPSPPSSLLDASPHYSAGDDHAIAGLDNLHHHVHTYGVLGGTFADELLHSLQLSDDWHPGEDNATTGTISPSSSSAETSAMAIHGANDLAFLDCAPAVSVEDMFFLSALSPNMDIVPYEGWELPEADKLVTQGEQSCNSVFMDEYTAVNAGICESVRSSAEDFPKLTRAASTSCLPSCNQLVTAASHTRLDAPQKLKKRAPKKQKSMSNSKQTEASDLSDGLEEDDSEKFSAADGSKGHASKNLVSERKRRMKLNERLYCLRAIVPKISKMDKASIVADAITYVQDLQKRVKDLHDEVLHLQASETEDELSCCAIANVSDSSSSHTQEDLPQYKVTELNISSIEQSMHSLRIHCRKGAGVLVQLIKTLDALNFDIVSANVTTVADHVLSTIVVKMNGSELLEADGLKKMMEQMFPMFGLDLEV